jgi:multidrug efflux pump subunit AcrB
MNIAEFSIKKKIITLVMTFLFIGGGIFSYEKLGRLEDPEFTIKDAQIITSYPGASPEEVEEEVTDKIEKAIQQLAQLKEITSISKKGVSIITATIKDKYNKKNPSSGLGRTPPKSK